MSKLRDGRNDLPILVHSELDDLGLPSRTFRVYAHLARRAGRDGEAFPSYSAIGRVCFAPDMPTGKPETWRRMAIAAVKDLVDRGLITKETRTAREGDSDRNVYRLTPRSEWRGGSDIAPPQGGGDIAPPVVTLHHPSRGVVIMHHGGDIAPPTGEDARTNPINEIQSEVHPSKSQSRGMETLEQQDNSDNSETNNGAAGGELLTEQEQASVSVEYILSKHDVEADDDTFWKLVGLYQETSNYAFDAAVRKAAKYSKATNVGYLRAIIQNDRERAVAGR